MDEASTSVRFEARDIAQIFGELHAAIRSQRTIAARGAGARRGSRELHTSGVRGLSAALVSCELNHFAPPSPAATLLGRARAVRCYGCASRAIALVAAGAIDVHVDLRSQLTPESFLASALLLEEAGGCVRGLNAKPIRGIESLLHATSLVATATPELAEEVLDVLGG